MTIYFKYRAKAARRSRAAFSCLRWRSCAGGGRIIAEGTVDDVAKNPSSRIGPFLADRKQELGDLAQEETFAKGCIRLLTSAIHTVHPLEVSIPKGRMTVVTGVSGSGKTTLVLESLVPALAASAEGLGLPSHVREWSDTHPLLFP